MRTNDPLDRDPRFYVRRRQAAQYTSANELQTAAVKMAGCIELIEHGGIGAPENRVMMKRVNATVFATILATAVVVLVTLDLSNLVVSSKYTYALLLLLMAVLLAMPRLPRTISM